MCHNACQLCNILILFLVDGLVPHLRPEMTQRYIEDIKPGFAFIDNIKGLLLPWQMAETSFLTARSSRRSPSRRFPSGPFRHPRGILCPGSFGRKDMPNTAAELMEAAQVARREHRLPDARRDLVEAMALCRQGQRRERIRALKALGQIERDMGQGEAALLLYDEAVTLCRAEADPLLLAHTVRHVADIHRNAGRLTEAEPLYDEALALYRGQQPNPLDLANTLRPLGLLLEATGRREEAKLLWEEARVLYAAAGVEAGVAECLARLALPRGDKER